MNTLKHLYKQAYLENRKPFVIGWIIFIAVAVLTFFLCRLANLNAREILFVLTRVYSHTLLSNVTFPAIFRNNFKSCIIIRLSSAIPVLFFPWVFIIFNSAIVGFVVYAGVFVHKNVWLLIALGLLPHGIIELSAVILSACLTIRLQRIWIGKIANAVRLERHRKAVGSLGHEIYRVIMQFVLIVVPALFIAAFIEAFVTKWLLSSFL